MGKLGLDKDERYYIVDRLGEYVGELDPNGYELLQKELRRRVITTIILIFIFALVIALVFAAFYGRDVLSADNCVYAAHVDRGDPVITYTNENGFPVCKIKVKPHNHAPFTFVPGSPCVDVNDDGECDYSARFAGATGKGIRECSPLGEDCWYISNADFWVIESVPPTETETPPPSDTPSVTPSVTPTETQTQTPTFTATFTATVTQTDTATATQTYTPTSTTTGSITPSDTPTETPTATVTPTETVTKTPKPPTKTQPPTPTPPSTMTLATPEVLPQTGVGDSIAGLIAIALSSIAALVFVWTIKLRRGL